MKAYTDTKVENVQNVKGTEGNIKETLFFKGERAYSRVKMFKRIFALIVALFPIVVGMFDFYFPYFVVYVVCAVGIYSPYILEHKFNLIILEEVRFLITFHTMLHTFFGKLFEFYRKYSWYDDVLHVLGGMLLAFIAMPLFYSVELNYSTFTKKGMRLKVDIDTFNFVNAAGVMWEIAEFMADLVFVDVPGYRLAQEGSLFDTMTDLIENNIGALIAIFIFWKLLDMEKMKKQNKDELMKSLIVS